jgi:hypothetical protein
VSSKIKKPIKGRQGPSSAIRATEDDDVMTSLRIYLSYYFKNVCDVSLFGSSLESVHYSNLHVWLVMGDISD